MDFPRRYASSSFGFPMMSPGSFTPPTRTLPASSRSKNFRTDSYWTSMESKRLGTSVAPTRSRTNFLILKVFLSGVCRRSTTAFSSALMP
jgi:hypothetical protein